MGFQKVISGPLVRSSYHAEQVWLDAVVPEDRTDRDC